MRITTFGLVAASLAFAGAAYGQTLPLKAGLVITRSVKLKPGQYLVPAPGDENGKAAIVIQGNDIVVDFNGAVLRGTPATTEPNDRKGVGVQIIGRNVTLKNAKVHGYKVAVKAERVPGIKVIDGDFSYNWKQKLGSTPEREDGGDWMSYHQNEKDEWLRYGAAIYLRDCDGFEAKGNRAIGGQNGLMITGCDRGLVWNNNFSFLSSLGLGMYRSSNNRVMHNNIDWCVRGFSYGVYNRGQDSAGILIYEQSSKNVFAYNSVTHGGDGFFLWAGQTTMDTGEGGCNDNLLYGNDFSHAPTNGIEATFSRNDFVNNKIMECWHGIWGGYSYDSKTLGNTFGYNAEGIAWEHGQDNLVRGNLFLNDNRAIDLWSNASQDPNWAYPKKRDTRSRDWTIERNLFRDTTNEAIWVRRSKDVIVRDNRFENLKLLATAGPNADGFRMDPSNTIVGGQPVDVTIAAGVEQPQRIENPNGKPAVGTMQPSGVPVLGLDPELSDYLKRFDAPWSPFGVGSEPEVAAMAPKPLAGGRTPFLKKGAVRGQRYILIDEWGPYDFKYPLLASRGEVVKEDGTTARRFEILGPKGKWSAKTLQGVGTVSAREGSVPGYLDVTLPAGKAANTKIELEYVGGPTVDYRGIAQKAGTKISFGYEKFFAPIDWTVKFFNWTTSIDANVPTAAPDPNHYKQVIAGTPGFETKTDRLDYLSGGAFVRGAPTDKFATVAEGTFEIAPGRYVLDVTTDDGIRLWVDGKMVIESWQYQGPTPYSATLQLGGKHSIRVEHFEIDGYAALKVALRPARQ